MKKKRERLEVIYDILDAVRSNGNKIKPTRLLQHSNLSPQMFKEYTIELTEKKFIKTENLENGKYVFTLTKKGFEFLEEYKVILGFIENFGL